MGTANKGESPKRRLVLVVIMMVSSLATVGANTSSSCPDRTEAQWDYVDSPGAAWTAELRTKVDLGFFEWVNDIDEYIGGPLVSYGGDGWTVRWESLDGLNARVVCFWPFSVRNVEFDIDQYDDWESGAKDIRPTATHEWGHVLGLGHSGEEDAWPQVADSNPTMSVCPDSSSENAGRSELAQDDEAALTAQNEVVSGWSTYTANASFEDSDLSGKEWWLSQNVPSWAVKSFGGGADGSLYYAEFKADGGPLSVLYNDTLITAYDGLHWRGRANYRKVRSTDDGYILVVVKHDYRTHELDPNCDDNPEHTPTGASTWWSYQVGCIPDMSWDYCTTEDIAFGGNNDLPVIQTRIAVWNRLTEQDGSMDAPLRLDRTRVQVDL